MKIPKKVYAAFLFVLMTAFSFNANAATVPLSCNWEFTYASDGAWGAYLNYSCNDNGVLAATKVVGVGAYAGQCSVSPQAGYTYSGSVCDPTILKYVADPQQPQSCGPNAGKEYGTILVGQYNPPPVNEIKAFCGACGYTNQVISSGANNAWIKVTCKN
ncbi:MAG: hypothetical protein B0W54_15510 [Cellvibrio sp. 79]|nr:MAG: hypothetical protein B0W54_15510 [Cellvibrio sp. 79]